MKKLKEKKYYNVIKLITLFLGLLLFDQIPLTIFNINYEYLSKIEQILYIFTCDILFLIIIIGWNFKTIKKDFKDYISNFKENIEISFKYWLLGFGIMIVSNFIIILIHGQIANNEESVRSLINVAPLYMGFATMIYAPFTEELIFRKGIKDIINNKKWLFILISGIVFGGMHIITNIKTALDILYIIPYSALGIVFAYTYNKTNNIFSTITMHAFHNGLAFFLYLIVYGIII